MLLTGRERPVSVGADHDHGRTAAQRDGAGVGAYFVDEQAEVKGLVRFFGDGEVA